MLNSNKICFTIWCFKMCHNFHTSNSLYVCVYFCFDDLIVGFSNNLKILFTDSCF